MDLLLPAAFSSCFGELPYFFGQPRNGGRLSTMAIARSVGALDQVLELVEMHVLMLADPPGLTARLRAASRKLVGMGGLEPPASTSRTWRATKLRYIP